MSKNTLSASLTRIPSAAAVSTVFNGLFNGARLAVGPIHFGRGGVLYLANEAEDGASLLGNAGELTLDAEGWAEIPYADSVHTGTDARDTRQLANVAERPRKKVIQRMDRQAAEAMLADFKSPLMRFKRFVVGLPIFKGHPDAPAFARRFPDKMPRGQVSEMEVGEKGLRFRPVLNEDGASLVTKEGWSAFSPLWRAPVRETLPDGTLICAPDKLVSIGLLPPGKENISGLSLANAAEDETENQNSAMNKRLQKFLASIGLSGVTAPADNADDAQFANALDSAETAITKLKDEHKALTDQLTLANAAEIEIEVSGAKQKVKVPAAVAALPKQLSEATVLANSRETEINTLKTNLTNERNARAKLVVLGAIAAGRVSASELDSRTLTLANAADFDAAAAEIEKLPTKLNTQSVLAGLGQRGNQQLSAGEQVRLLVNAKMEEPAFKAMPEGERYREAWKTVEADAKHSALFANMADPTKAKK
jgi:hypothetical protein